MAPIAINAFSPDFIAHDFHLFPGNVNNRHYSIITITTHLFILPGASNTLTVNREKKCNQFLLMFLYIQ